MSSVGIVGGGVLGLTLAYRLARRGHQVSLFEAAPELGGLATSHDYGPFVWDRYYHCILPTDRHLVGLLKEIGLGDGLRWTDTGTGYYARGRFYDMNGNADFLRFPLLGLVDKARLGAMVLYATRFADPWKLYGISAADWLARICGKRGYEIFWKPLLIAKFGPFHDRVAAVFIWATLSRLFGARSTTTAQEKLGYCTGGYKTILGCLEGRLRDLGATIRIATPVTAIRPDGTGCEIRWRMRSTDETATFDQVFFTGPTRLARKVAAGDYHTQLDRTERAHPTSGQYLGVACLVLVLPRPLTPYYVTNIGDDRIRLTGVIEMTNLIDRQTETKGLSLLYLPQYMDSEDPRLVESGDAMADEMIEHGIMRLFPDFDRNEVIYGRVHRVRYVQPLPLVRAGASRPANVTLERPFQVLNTSMLTCATLNNNEVVGFVSHFDAVCGPTLA